MNRIIYKGYIFKLDHDYLPNLDINKKHNFVNNGYFIGYGRKQYNSYVLCDDNGNELKEYERIQFVRNQHNIFFVETVH